ncbi:MAG: PQQ-binding-like beta-propeller repeat protein [Myxococcota bacterium]
MKGCSWLFSGIGASVLLLEAAAAPPPTPIFISKDRIEQGPFGFTELKELTSSDKPAFPLFLQWSRALPRDITWAFSQGERATPLLVEGQLWVGTSRAKGIRILEPRVGATVRVLPLKGGVEAPMVQDPASGDVLVADNAGFVSRFRKDGSRVWEFESGGPFTTSPLLAGDKVLVRTTDGDLVALNAESGEQLWSYKRDRKRGEGLSIFGSGMPAVVDNRVLAGFDDGAAVALNLGDGTLIWEQTVLADERWVDVDGSPLVLSGDRVIFPAFRGTTVCLRVSSGELLWKSPHGGVAAPLGLASGKVLLTDSDGYVVGLNGENGERLWRWEVPGKVVPVSPVLWRGLVVVGTSSGELFMLDPESGEVRWTLSPEVLFMGFSSPPLLTEQALYFVSDGGYVYAYGASDYRTPEIMLQGEGIDRLATAPLR